MPTEARMSIRESLRIFGKLEAYLDDENTKNKIAKSSLSCLLFERIVAQHAGIAGKHVPFDTSIRSCGLTSQCFAALFFSRSQLQQNHGIRYTNGSDMVQLWDNWNLVLYGMWRRRVGDGWDHGKSNDTTRTGNTLLSTMKETVARILRYRASNISDDLFASLLRSDPPNELPRVVFCNLTWVLLHQNNKNNANAGVINDERSNNEEVLDDNDISSRDIKDHQWTFIKHGDDSFQLVQGYMDDNDSETSCAIATDSNKEGYCLSRWQNHPQSGRFASRRGFSAAELRVFRGGIRRFASSPCFDASSYQQLFGVWHPASHGVAVWPSVSFRELDDNSIEGYGDRFVSHSVEAALRSFELRGESTSS